MEFEEMKSPLPMWAQYLEWVSLSKIRLTQQEFSNYNALIHVLATIPFEYVHPMDENRYNDALGLRKEFETLTECSLSLSPGYIRNATVFEVIAALAARCEKQLMRNVQLGDRSKTWFFEMLKNLDILKWDFNHLQYEYENDIRQKIHKWLSRSYKKDGSGGGMFPLKYPHTDQRNEQIWNQLMAYLQENWMEDDGLALYQMFPPAT